MSRQPTAAEVVTAINEELKEGSALGGWMGGARAHLRRARELQRQFRSEPIGGRLVALKRAFHWWTASAFDRQAKAVEALMDAVEELASQAEIQAARSAVEPGGKASSSSPGPPAVEAGTQPPGESIQRAMTVSAEMLMPERLLLYSLVCGLRPARSLEIGTLRGGSAALICAALADVGSGCLICVDPEPQVLPEAEEWMRGLATVLAGSSPEILGEAESAAGGPFDFVLIDGDHSAEGVLRDVEGVLGHLADEAYLLFHDCHHAEVRAGIDEALCRHAELLDAGILSTLPNPLDEVDEKGRPVVWGGLRLLRFVTASP